jgi:hypothetical protein
MAHHTNTFNVIRELSVVLLDNGHVLTHAKKGRRKRISAMRKYLSAGIAVTAFEVIDNGRHVIHMLYTNGVVKILDVHTHNMITSFCHSVFGIKKYWDNSPKPFYYNMLIESCKTNYPIYQLHCKDADDE